MAASDNLGLQFEFTKGGPWGSYYRNGGTGEEDDLRSKGLKGHHLTAKVGDKEVGHLEWGLSGEDSKIDHVHVHPEHQRQGIGTALWSEAHKVASSTRGVKAPKHSKERTDAGDAWARSVSKRVPERVEAPEARWIWE